jgi:hypothetical protein
MPGMWEPVRKQSLGTWLNINFVHAINVRTGTNTDRLMLLTYGFPFVSPGPWATRVYLWDRTAAPPVEVPASQNNTTNLLCAGHCQAGNGKIVFAGGHWDPVSGPNGTPPKDLDLFDPANSSAPWAPRAAMLKTRWYPTCTTLPSGKILITYGFLNKVNNAFGDIYEHEVFDPAVAPPPFPTQATQVFPNTQQYLFEPYPYVFVLPNGHVLFAGLAPYVNMAA